MENVVFIVLDSLRKDRLSAYNEDVDFTENIEEFSEEAEVFEEAYAQAPWTLPSHASIFTGMYPWEHEATQKNLELDVDETHLAERFKEEGYDTACFSINGFLNNDANLTDGFDRVENMNLMNRFSFLNKFFKRFDKWVSKTDESYIRRKIFSIGEKLFNDVDVDPEGTEKILGEAKSFVDNSEESFFVFINLMDAHEPYFPPKEYRGKHGDVDPSEICQVPDRFYAEEDRADFEEIKSAYDASVDYMDDQIGDFLNFMEEKDLMDDTVVVIAADHGQMLGEDGLYGHQYSVNKHLNSVPLIVKKEGVDMDADQIIELRQLYDLVPAWAGVEDESEFTSPKVAKGGYEFPDFMIHRVPKDRKEEFYKKLRFSETQYEKLIEEENSDGSKDYISKNKRQGESSIDLRKEVREIGESSTGKDIEDKDEEVKERLRKLGYG
jgi:arylsulfatase A-like enzyme